MVSKGRLKNQDPLTLLNLACMKYTGYPLPVSDFDANNWKYEKEFTPNPCDDESHYPSWVYGYFIKKAKWSPNPHFNPLQLSTPSNDFGVRVLRSLVVDEIRFCKHGLGDLKKQILKISNPYGYKDNWNYGAPTSCPIKIELNWNHRYLPQKIFNLFLEDDESFDRHLEDRRAQLDYADTHHHRTLNLDGLIFRNKCQQWSGYRHPKNKPCPIFTKNGTLRKTTEIIRPLLEQKFLAIGMSAALTSPYYFAGATYSEAAIATQAEYWERDGCSFYELTSRLYHESTKLTPQDFIEIYNPSSIDKKEKINQKLIANFPLPE